MPETGKVKNVGGEDLLDAWSQRLVEAGQVIEVPIEQVYAYTQQAERWVPFDNAAKRAHKEATEEREADEAPAVEAAPEQSAQAGDDSQEG